MDILDLFTIYEYHNYIKQNSNHNLKRIGIQISSVHFSDNFANFADEFNENTGSQNIII